MEYFEDDLEYAENKENINTENIDDVEVITQDSDIFEEILIMEVRDRPCLWDQRLDLRLRTLEATKRAWEEISRFLGVETKVLQKRWKNLRDTFRRKQQDMKTYIPSGSGAGKKPDQWRYYNHMEFLMPTMEFRKTFSNLNVSETEKSHLGCETSSRFMPIKSSTDTLLSQSQCSETAVAQRSTIEKSPSVLHSSSTVPRSNVSLTISNPPLTSVLERASPSISSGPSSPTASTLSNTKKRSRSTSRESQDTKRIREEDKLECLLLSQVTEPRKEEQIFCNFLQSRLEKLDKTYYMRITHIMIQELMKIEAEQAEDK